MTILREGVVSVDHGDLIVTDLPEILEDDKGYFILGFQKSRFDVVLNDKEKKLIRKCFESSVTDDGIKKYSNTLIY